MPNLKDRKTSLSETLLRISGAIDLLEEVLGESEGVQELQIKEDPTAAGIVEVPNVVRQSLEKAKKLWKKQDLQQER